MGLWWRKPEKRDSRDESMPLVRLQNVSKTFKGDADEDTVALAEVSRHAGPRANSQRGRLKLRVGFRRASVMQGSR